MTVDSEISGLNLLKKFSYITDMKDYVQSPLALKINEISKREIRSSGSSPSLISMRFNDQEFHEFYMEQMTNYPKWFGGKGTNCSGCNQKIILPIDLRRDAGASYHGKCFTSSIYESLRKGTGYQPRVIEYLLRVTRTCTPPHEDASPLTEGILETLEIDNREQVERFYWNNETPIK